ncbi:hypothetical protein PybrP1_012029 [[Pythium] brassicae (nom. inval.)]|nr:hypothetical protein PybrP1_012029 [[Pythium] brassicae (nom. inval.)]
MAAQSMSSSATSACRGFLSLAERLAWYLLHGPESSGHGGSERLKGSSAMNAWMLDLCKPIAEIMKFIREIPKEDRATSYVAASKLEQQGVSVKLLDKFPIDTTLYPPEWYPDLLVAACAAGHTPMVAQLLETDAALQPLTSAMRHSHLDIVQQLDAAGQIPCGGTVIVSGLRLACSRGDITMVDTLLAHYSCNADAWEHHPTLLRSTVQSNNLQVIKLLLECDPRGAFVQLDQLIHELVQEMKSGGAQTPRLDAIVGKHGYFAWDLIALKASVAKNDSVLFDLLVNHIQWTRDELDAALAATRASSNTDMAKTITLLQESIPDEEDEADSVEPPPVFAPGDIVEARKRGRTTYSSAMIDRCWLNGTYDVRFADFSEEGGTSDGASASEAMFTKLEKGLYNDKQHSNETDANFEEGDAVEARFKGSREFYPAKITFCRSYDLYDLQYDDGDQDTLVPRNRLEHVQKAGDYNDPGLVKSESRHRRQWPEIKAVGSTDRSAPFSCNIINGAKAPSASATISWREVEEWKNVDLILSRKRRFLNALSGSIESSKIPWGEEFAAIQSLKRFAVQHPDVLREHISSQLEDVGADLSFLLKQRLAPFLAVLPAVFNTEKRFLCDSAYEVLKALVVHCSGRKLVLLLLQHGEECARRDDIRLLNLTSVYVEKCFATLNAAEIDAVLARPGTSSSILTSLGSLLVCKAAPSKIAAQKSLSAIHTALGDASFERVVRSVVSDEQAGVILRHTLFSGSTFGIEGGARSPPRRPVKVVMSPVVVHQGMSILQRMVVQRQNRVVPAFEQ